MDQGAQASVVPADRARPRRLRRKTTVPLQQPPAVPPDVASRQSEIAWREQFLAQEDLVGEDTGRRKAVYLVTLPCPRSSVEGSGENGLRAPGQLSHEEVEKAFLDVFANPVHVDGASERRGRGSLTLERMVIFKELHAPDEAGDERVHYHVALLGSASFRFAAYKRALRMNHSLASHWSCTHEGYWSAVRYGVVPSPKKPEASLDPEPRAWARLGAHPPLFDSAQEPTTAQALKRRRETAVKTASEQGSSEPRAHEMDLYPIIVQAGIRNSPDKPWAAKQLISHVKEFGSPALVRLAWSLRHRLPSIIDDVWQWETVEGEIAMLGESRADRFVAASREACVCQTAWRQVAEWVLHLNGISIADFAADLWRSIRDGRREGIPVVTLVGRHGGEGKSFLLSPLKHIFGRDHVQVSPQRGSFPLLGLETKRLALLDEWEFSEHVIPLSLQLLWFEGKAMPITRPQNKDYTGHILYHGTAPVFITCKEVHVEPVTKRARAALADGRASEDTMLLRRLKLYYFHQPMPTDPNLHIPECGSCLARMVLDHAAHGP